MQDAELVECLQASHHLNHYLPDVLLFHEVLVILTLAYLLEDISSISKLHHDAQRARVLIKESLFVRSDERVFD